MLGFFLILNNINNEREQKKINIISVDIKNEETLTDGNKQNDNVFIIANSLF